jgi:hypothetical protein
MTGEQGKKIEKFEFTPEGETLGYISLDQAVLLARHIVRQEEQRYLLRLGWTEIAWSDSKTENREDSYRVVLQFRLPARGLNEEQTGEEEFIFDHLGELRDRQMLLWPKGISAVPRLAQLPPLAWRATRIAAGVALVLWGALFMLKGGSVISQGRGAGPGFIEMGGALLGLAAGGLLLEWNRVSAGSVLKLLLLIGLAVSGFVLWVVAQSFQA